MNPYHAMIARQLDEWMAAMNGLISRCSITLRRASAARGGWLS